MMCINVATAKLIARLPETAAAAILASDPAVSPRVAARLTRRSGQVIREAIANRSLPSQGDGACRYVHLDDLARWQGRNAYSATELRAAWRLAAKDNDIAPYQKEASPSRRPDRLDQRQHHRDEAPNV